MNDMNGMKKRVSRTWMGSAACTDPESRGLPWTTDAERTPSVLAEAMREVCRACPVLVACAAYAITEDISGGWWAGRDRGANDHDSGESGDAGTDLVTAVPVLARDGRLLDFQEILPIPQPIDEALDGAA